MGQIGLFSFYRDEKTLNQLSLSMLICCFYFCWFWWFTAKRIGALVLVSAANVGL